MAASPVIRQEAGSPQVPADASPEPGPSRRAVIVGAGIAVVAGAAGFAWFAAAGPKPGPVPSAGGYPAPTGATAGSSDAALATVAQIPEGGGLILAEQGVVLTREAGDTVHGFSTVCTHAGCPVNEVSGGKIRCPCHGSTFDVATGAVIDGPAPAPLPAVPVTVTNGSVFRG